MSEDVAIRVENLSKRYIISHKRESGDGLRHVLQDKALGPWRALRSKFRKSEIPKSHNISASQDVSVSAFQNSSSSEEFYALRDVSFEIKRGEVVGIIGRNGAGKSTLLKILSRITEPTNGRITINGRVASLLEVGTGFHPELTGRENIFLNGAILGMSRVEIKSKFDEIVAFAEIERFLDTPVKRYSSGMYVRLAFAVAAHLEPEILIVDEVLAVGDAEFQKKCLGKMQDVSKGGRTVLFVSHNMAAIRQLCKMGILLSKGRLAAFENIELAVHKYMEMATDPSQKRASGALGLQLADVFFIDAETCSKTAYLTFNHNYRLSLEFQCSKPPLIGGIVVEIYDDFGTLVSSICGLEEGIGWVTFLSNTIITFNIPELRLFPNRYRVAVAIYATDKWILRVESICVFDVESAIVPGSTMAYKSQHGFVRIGGGGTVDSGLHRILTTH